MDAMLLLRGEHLFYIYIYMSCIFERTFRLRTVLCTVMWTLHLSQKELHERKPHIMVLYYGGSHRSVDLCREMQLLGGTECLAPAELWRARIEQMRLASHVE